MSSITDPQPEIPAEEELVAYLDGELPPEDCRRVEARLASDADYRRQLHHLDQAWEALDALPASRGDDDFVRTTMEMVAIAAEDDLSRHAARAAAAGRRRMWWLAGAGIAAAAVGFAAARLVLSRGDAAFLADLPVIRHLDLLTHIEDVEFVRRLPSRVPMDQLTSDEDAVRDELLNLEWVNAPSPEDRQEWLEALPPKEKATLVARTNRFQSLPGHERDRLRSLQREIREAHDAAQLQRNLVAYGQWLSRLSLGEQEELKEELRGLPLDEQMDRVRRFVRQANQRASRQLSPEDAETLRRAVLAFTEERKSRIVPEMRRRGRADAARWLDEPRGALMILGRELQNDDSVNDVRERIVKQLSPEAQTHLESLRPWARRLQLWQWIRDSLKPNWGPGELERFFANELDNNQRERLLNLSPGDMQAELERLCVASEFGVRRPPPPELFERDPRARGANGPRGPGPNDRKDHRPPRGPGPPPPHHERQDAI